MNSSNIGSQLEGGFEATLGIVQSIPLTKQMDLKCQCKWSNSTNFMVIYCHVLVPFPRTNLDHSFYASAIFEDEITYFYFNLSGIWVYDHQKQTTWKLEKTKFLIAMPRLEPLTLSIDIFDWLTR